MAQDLKAYNGKILRVNDDGTVPADNPFFKSDTARKEIWTYGHRNPQGLAFEPGSGNLFASEHGPTGGDEINSIKKGRNYGWPVIHHQDTFLPVVMGITSRERAKPPTSSPGSSGMAPANALSQQTLPTELSTRECRRGLAPSRKPISINW
ncbi:hypothetical protein GS398_13770 [Pedobacter sp. HMF7056]|uniref:Glucose/Sorbosone dehydrogenase domain-containing protein n=1 Tax=Hufsiella ginkgonis TaxID=2695274 RepID=A0A7K1XZY4_9SPHI|nr:hypothetical protein [Hufsiella ginkgonis]